MFKKASLTIEQAVLVAIVAAAIISTVVIIKRAVNDKYRQTGDIFGFGRQYRR